MNNDKLKEIKSKLNPDTLEQVLLRAFPDIEIYIIRGFDEFSEEAYTHSAYFNKEEAENSMKSIPPNGDGELSDTYCLISTTFYNIYYDKVYDQRTEKPLNQIDIGLVYESLTERLKKS